MPMLARKLVRSKFKNSSGDGSGCAIPVLIIIIVATIILRLITWLQEPVPVPLLPEVDGIVRLEHTEDISNYTDVDFLAPTETYGAKLQAIAVYTEPNDLLPVGTVSLVYERDGWRFMQIDYRPSTYLEEYEPGLRKYQTEELWLNDYNTALIVDIWDFPSCMESEVEGFPGKCEFTDQLYFNDYSTLVSISADGNKVTRGELIGMAKSIADYRVILTEPTQTHETESDQTE